MHQRRTAHRLPVALLLLLGALALTGAAPADSAKAPGPSRSDFLSRAAINLGSLAAVVGLAIFAIRRRERWELREYTLRSALHTATAAAAARVKQAQDSAPEVLRCPKCTAPLPLADVAQLPCPSCGEQATIPPAYLARVQAQAEEGRALQTEARELASTELATHPAWAVAWLLGAMGLGYGLVHLNNLAADAPVDSTLGIFGIHFLAALIVPLGMVISAAGQVTAWAEIGVSARGFAARTGAEGKGFRCRICGAPLPGSGGAALCPYCGAQNLLRANLESEAQKAKDAAHALGASVEHARSVRWRWFWTGVQVPSFLLAAIGGLLFLSMGSLGLLMAFNG